MLNQNLSTSGMSGISDIVDFDLKRDTENGVRCFEEQEEEHEVPMAVIEEID